MRVGRLLDHPTIAGGVDYGRLALELALADAGCRVDLVDEHAAGSVEHVLTGARRLADAGCVLILGPAVTDFAVPLVPVLDELCVPSVNWSGSQRARGAWAFQLKVGSLPDEAGLLVRLVAARGWRRVAVVRDEGPIGEEYGRYVVAGLATLTLDEVVEIVGVEHAARALGYDAVVYLGFGASGASLCRELRMHGFAGAITGNVGIGIRPSADVEGVIFTDVVDDANPVLARFLERWRRAHAVDVPTIGLAAAHDLAVTTATAIRLAPAPTAAGIRAGLERIAAVPAACGAPGTTIAFGAWDRDGYKGQLIVLREIAGGRAVSHRL